MQDSKRFDADRPGVAMNAVSPLAPKRFPDLPEIGGVRAAAANAGIRYKGRDDLLLVELAPGAAIAGAPHPPRSPPRRRSSGAAKRWPAGGRGPSIVNSGNANAFTGRQGQAAVEHTVAAAARALGCAGREVFVSSTGVIGEPLPAERTIVQALPGLAAALAPGGWEAAARAIMTTDTFPKGASATARIGGKEVKIAGIAKGSGMIAPDMATMLAYVFTDAAVPPALLQRLTSRAVERSFNAITVDSDTSTSDTVAGRRDRRGRQSGARPRHAARLLPRAGGRSAATWRIRSSATARGRPNSWRSPSPGRRPPAPPGASGSPSPTRRW